MAGSIPRELDDDEPLSAAWLNSFVAFIAANQVTFAPDSLLNGTSGADGWTVSVQATPDTFIKITYSHADGSYSWVEAVPAPSGTFTVGFRKGYCAADPSRTAPPDPAWEYNLSTTVPIGSYAEAHRDPAVGRLSFQSGSCPS